MFFSFLNLFCFRSHTNTLYSFHALFIIFVLHLVKNKYCIDSSNLPFYTPTAKLCMVVYWNQVVRPSDRLSIDAILSGLLLLQFCFKFVETLYDALWPLFVWTVRIFEFSNMLFFVFTNSHASYQGLLSLSGLLLLQFWLNLVETFYEALWTWETVHLEFFVMVKMLLKKLYGPFFVWTVRFYEFSKMLFVFTNNPTSFQRIF